MVKEKNKVEKDNWCHYSDLPSPGAYVQCTDYDSMGNHGRFPKINKRVKVWQKIFQRLKINK
jgi:hypothetical protein